MSDWKSRALPASGTDWKSRAVQLPTSSTTDPTQDPGALEALARGAEQGATLGFGDEINGALSTAGDVLTGQNQDLGIIDDYRKQRDDSRQLMDAAEKAHPYVSGAGNLLGGLATALATGGGSAAAEGAAGAAEAATLLDAAKTGAGIGAVAGLGNSKADLTKGQLGQALNDTETGAAGGAILGGALHSAVGGIKQIAGLTGDLKSVSDFGEAAKQGFNGRLLIGKTANKNIQQDLLDAYGNIEPSLQDAQNVAGAAKNEKLLNAQQSLNMAPWLKGFNDSVGNVKTNESADPAVANDLAKLTTFVSRFLGGNEEEGLVGKLNPEGGLSPLDADKLRAYIANLSAAGDNGLKTVQGRALATRLVAPLNRAPSITETSLGLPQDFQALSGESGLINQNVPGINDLNSQISSIQKAKDAIPSLNQLMNSEKLSQSGTTALSSLQDFLDKAPKDVLGNQIDNIQSLAKAKDLASQISAPSFFHRSSTPFADTIRGTKLGAGNLLGMGVRQLYNATPEALKQLGAHIMGTDNSLAGQKLGTMLGNASEKDNIGRNALFFAIQQNPEYRRILGDATQPSDDEMNQ